VTTPDEVWLPLVDEPIGTIVRQIEGEDPELSRLVSHPQRLLAFRTFAYIRVGLMLGQLLVDEEVDPYDGSANWAEQLLRNPAHRARIAAEVRAVGEEVAHDPRYRAAEGYGPDDDARARFRDFARRRLAE
jgi:hypothetical protein